MTTHLVSKSAKKATTVFVSTKAFRALVEGLQGITVLNGNSRWKTTSLGLVVLKIQFAQEASTTPTVVS